MRWKHPQKFDLRTKTAFLWLPKRIYGETRWLETATWEEQFNYTRGGYAWKPRWWVDEPSEAK